MTIFSQKSAILKNFQLLKVENMGKVFHNFFADWGKNQFFGQNIHLWSQLLAFFWYVSMENYWVLLILFLHARMEDRNQRHINWVVIHHESSNKIHLLNGSSTLKCFKHYIVLQNSSKKFNLPLPIS